MRLPACFRGLALHLPDTLILDMRKDLHRVVAIDGPAASGKSSVARELAHRLGFAYVNSGAMYRAVTWSVLNRGIQAVDAPAIANFIIGSTLDGKFVDRQFHLLIDDVDLTSHLHED